MNPIKPRSNPSWSFRKVLRGTVSPSAGVVEKETDPERNRDFPKVTQGSEAMSWLDHKQAFCLDTSEPRWFFCRLD